jgi:rRNA biogenesis protein RRP5
VSLGLKKSYFDSDDERVPTDISHCPEMSGDLNMSFVLPGPEPRASVPPLQVSLDENEGSDQESGQKGHATANGTESNVKKSHKRLKEKTRKRKQRFSHISFSLYL